MRKRIVSSILILVMVMMAFTSVAMADTGKDTGLYKDNGQWKYYENGEISKATGLVQRPDNKTWHYVENGTFKKVTGLVQCIQPGSSEGKWYYVSGGTLSNETGLVQCVQPGTSKGKWYYVVNGKLSKSTGMVQCIQPGISKGKWYYVVNGKLSKESGLVQCIQPGSSYGKWYLVDKGRYLKGTGLVNCIQPGSSNGKTYYVKNGKLYKKTETVTLGYVDAKLKKGRLVSFGANKNSINSTKFPTFSSLGMKGYSSSLNNKVNKKLIELIELLAKQGYNFAGFSDLQKADAVARFIGANYYYNVGAYTAEGMLDKGYGTCFAYSDLSYCMLKKLGINQSWLTVPGRNIDHGGNIYGSQHRTVVFKFGGDYYELDANKAFLYMGSGMGNLFEIEKIPKDYALYLLGKSNDANKAAKSLG